MPRLFSQYQQDNATKQAKQDLDGLVGQLTASETKVLFSLVDWLVKYVATTGPRRLVRMLLAYSNPNPK
jgi:hypothetical protein